MHPQIPDFQKVVSQPNIQLSDYVSFLYLKKCTLMTGIVVQGHILDKKRLEEFTETQIKIKAKYLK